MKKYLFSIGMALMLTLLVVSPVMALDLGLTNLTSAASTAGFGEGRIQDVIGKVVKVVLSALGLVSLVIFIFAGFQWMTSGGSDDKIKGAQKLMSNAVIGLVIVLIAYAATHFIVQALVGVTEAV